MINVRLSEYENQKCACFVEIERLQAERDKLLEENKGLKADLEKRNDQRDSSLLQNAELKVSRDEWRGMAEKLGEAARGLSFGTDWNNGTHAKIHGYRQNLLDAVADYSKLSREKGE